MSCQTNPLGGIAVGDWLCLNRGGYKTYFLAVEAKHNEWRSSVRVTVYADIDNYGSFAWIESACFSAEGVWNFCLISECLLGGHDTLAHPSWTLEKITQDELPWNKENAK